MAKQQRNLTLLVLLGYLYVFGLATLLLVIAVVFIFALVYFRIWYLAKLAIIPIVSIWVMLKSLWVKFPIPQGLAMTRDEAPELFKKVDYVRDRAGGPKIDTVLLNDEFNCSIVQYPRLGLFGWHKNFLILGLPLLDAMSLVEFESVLGHEMGHLSGKHGQFGSWLYSVKVFWRQLLTSVHAKNTWDQAPLRKFAEWFYPKFDTMAFSIMREHEYAADELGASIAGADVMARALILTDVKGGLFHTEYWPDFLDRVKTEPEPPNDLFFIMRQRLVEPVKESDAAKIIKQRWREHREHDSHPSLSERISELRPEYANMELDLLAKRFVEDSHEQKSAAEVLLKGKADEVRTALSVKWREPISASWREQHKLCAETNVERKELESKLEDRSINAEQSDRLAVLLTDTENREQSIATIRQLTTMFPDRAQHFRCLGSLYLKDEKQAEATECLERAAKLDPGLEFQCVSWLATYADEHGQFEQAKRYEERASDLASEILQAAVKANQIDNTDEFSEHTLNRDALNNICNALYGIGTITKAWLVRRKLPALLGEYQNVIVLDFGPGFGQGAQAKAETGFRALSDYKELNEMSALLWGRCPKKLAKACKEFPSAQIFDRKDWKMSPAYAPIAPTTPLPASRLLSTRNKVRIAVLAIVAGFVGFGIISHKDDMIGGPSESQSQESQSQEAQEPEQTKHPPAHHRGADAPDQKEYATTDSYMHALQARIKRHWYPPRGDKSKRVMVVFKVAKDGKLLSRKIVQSAHDEVVDAAALGAVDGAAPFPPLPPDLDVPDVDVEFTFDYNLYDKSNRKVR